MASLVRVTLLRWNRPRKSVAQEREHYFLRQGRCPTCGVHTHEPKTVGIRTVWVPLRNDNVEDGRCLMCVPPTTPPNNDNDNDNPIDGQGRTPPDKDREEDSIVADGMETDTGQSLALPCAAETTAAHLPRQPTKGQHDNGERLVRRVKFAIGCGAVLASASLSMVALMVLIRNSVPLQLTPGEWGEPLALPSVAPATLLVAPSPSPMAKNSPRPTMARNEYVRQVIANLSDPWLLETPSEPQYKALEWFLRDDAARPTSTQWQMEQRYAMALFFFSTRGDTIWKKPRDFLSFRHECQWHPNVHCFAHEGVPSDQAGFRVTGLEFEGGTHGLYNDFGKTGIEGRLPEEMALALPYLSQLVITEERLSGSIPSNLGTLSYLRDVDLSSNRHLFGTLPDSLGRATELRSLAVAETRIEGTIPTTLGQLSKLRNLWLGWNWMTGPIPSELGQLSQLEFLMLQMNYLTGTLPLQLGNLTKLYVATLHKNDLTGTVPPSLCESHVFKKLSVDCPVHCTCCTECFDATTGKIIHLSGA